jgi:hypothetical protein
LTITIIHILEVITLLLVLGKLLQIRKLYKLAATPAPPPAIKTQDVHQSRHQKHLSTPQEAKTRISVRDCLGTASNNTFNQLPMPEVSFSFSHEERTSDTSETAKIRQSVLHNYIDDFFPKAAPLPEPIVEELPLGNYQTNHPAEDEFIIVQETNEKLIRAMTLSDTKALLSRL